ncbi:hypothetical protein GJAV_G00198840 [Gymnothorax javanicus]|nr:hypothetical protein GJAV_G00198840 [Gymnothorax javanicus]
MGCYDCCVRCLGGVPYTSLVATLMCFSGIALFCGCGHQALAETERLIETYFARNLQDYITLAYLIQLLHHKCSQADLRGVPQYCVRPMPQHHVHHSDLCPGCYLAPGFAVSALPVYFFYNVATTCHTIDELSETATSINQLCIDARQYGLLPWNALPGKACGMTLSNVCQTREFSLTYDLYIAAFAGAGITLLALMQCFLRLVVGRLYLKERRKRETDASQGFASFRSLPNEQNGSLRSPYTPPAQDI